MKISNIIKKALVGEKEYDKAMKEFSRQTGIKFTPTPYNKIIGGKYNDCCFVKFTPKECGIMAPMIESGKIEIMIGILATIHVVTKYYYDHNDGADSCRVEYKYENNKWKVYR